MRREAESHRIRKRPIACARIAIGAAARPAHATLVFTRTALRPRRRAHRSGHRLDASSRWRKTVNAPGKIKKRSGERQRRATLVISSPALSRVCRVSRAHLSRFHTDRHRTARTRQKSVRAASHGRPPGLHRPRRRGTPPSLAEGRRGAEREPSDLTHLFSFEHSPQWTTRHMQLTTTQHQQNNKTLRQKRQHHARNASGRVGSRLPPRSCSLYVY